MKKKRCMPVESWAIMQQGTEQPLVSGTRHSRLLYMEQHVNAVMVYAWQLSRYEWNTALIGLTRLLVWDDVLAEIWYHAGDDPGTGQ